MKNRLVLTLTTTRGSRQYSLNKLARYMAVSAIAFVLLGFVLGNLMLVKTTDELSLLEIDHRQLESQYEQVVDDSAVVRTELDGLSDTLAKIETDRNKLQHAFSSLAVQYRDVFTSSEIYKSQVDSLSSAVEEVETEKDRLQAQSTRVLSERSLWEGSLRMLEAKMGLPASETMTLERSKELQQIANERLFMLRGLPNGRPVKEGRLTDGFGYRTHPVTHEKKMHNGLDWSVNRGTKIYATADGAVEYSGYHKKSGYGKLVIISHNFGFKTYYGHMDKLLVKNGSVVRKGQLIGLSGNTGISTGPHLHYEVRYLFKPLNPRPFVNWDMENYEQIFTKVKDIAWDSLRAMHPLNQIEAPLL